MKTKNPLAKIYYNLQKRYRLVAYNNRLYPDWKFVNPETYTMIGIKSWLAKYGRTDKYLYDIYDVKTGELKYDYEKMILEYLRIRSMFNDEKTLGFNKKKLKKIKKIELNPILHQESLKEYIFCFKHKWEHNLPNIAVKPYFEELMILFNNYFDRFNQDNVEIIYPKNNLKSDKNK